MSQVNWGDFTPIGNGSNNVATGGETDWSQFAIIPKATTGQRLRDLGTALLGGAVGATKAISDAAGANNAASRGLGTAQDNVQGWLSPERQAEKSNRARLIQEAEQSGSGWREFSANAAGVIEAPFSAAAEAAGSIVPVAAALLTPTGRNAVASRLLAAGLGAAQGAGSVKGSIYDAVRDNKLQQGATEAQASAAADAAQSYGGTNTANIAVGAGLGALTSTTGVENVIQRAVTGKAAMGGTNALRRIGMGAVTEGVPEAVQGGQERMASNVALQNEGVDVPTWQGLVGQATTEGLAGGLLGGAGNAASRGPRAQPSPQPVADSAAAQATTTQAAAQTASSAAPAQPKFLHPDDFPETGIEPSTVTATPPKAPAEEDRGPFSRVLRREIDRAEVANMKLQEPVPEPATPEPSLTEQMASLPTDQRTQADILFGQINDPTTPEGVRRFRRNELQTILNANTERLQAESITGAGTESEGAIVRGFDARSPTDAQVLRQARGLELAPQENHQPSYEGGIDFTSESTAPTVNPFQTEIGQLALAEDLTPGAPMALNRAHALRTAAQAQGLPVTVVPHASGRGYAVQPTAKLAPAARAQMPQAEGLASLSYDRTPSGRMVVDPQGVAVTERVAEIETPAMQELVAAENMRQRRADMGVGKLTIRPRSTPESGMAVNAGSVDGQWRAGADLQEKERGQLADAINPINSTLTHENKAQTAIESEANSAPRVVSGDAPAKPAAQPVGDEKPFVAETGTMGIPRAEMPQVPTANHGGLVKHLNAQGIAHETTTVDAAQLKPTQAEYSPSKVEAAKSAVGDRAVIVSNDGHIIDGHHQAVAAAEEGKQVKAIVLDAPVEQALAAVKASPSANTNAAAAAARAEKPVFRREAADAAPGVDFDVASFLQIMNTGQPAGAAATAAPPSSYSPAARAEAVRAVKGTADAIRQAWANGPEVIVAFDMQDAVIPESARRADLKQRSGGARGAPEGFYYQGKVYLMASKLKTPNDAARVLFHEALGHHGLRGLFGKDLGLILNQVATMRKADVEAKIEEYGLRHVNRLDRRTAAEEVLAEMAQSTPQIGFVRRAVAAIRTWLRQHVPGFKSLALTDAELIRNFILPARAWVERGGPDGGNTANATFSREAAPELRVATNFMQARQAVKDFQGKELVNAATGMKAVVSRNTLDKMLSSKAVQKSETPSTHSMAVANADTLFEQAILGWSKPDRADDLNIKAVHRFFAPLVVDGRTKLVKLTVKETTLDRANSLYTLEAVELNETQPAKQWVEAAAREDGVSLETKNPLQRGVGPRESQQTGTRETLAQSHGVTPDRSAEDVHSLAQGVEHSNSDEPMFSRSTMAEAIGNAIKGVTVTNIKQRAGFKVTDYMGLALQTLGRRQLTEVYKPMLPQLQRYSDLMAQMDADKNEAGAGADELATDWGKLKDERELAELMHDATLAQMDPAKPYVEGDKKTDYQALRQRYETLTPEAREIYARARDSYSEHMRDVRTAIKERIDRSGMTGERKQNMLKAMEDDFFGRVKGVYFPLARFGQYVVVVKNESGKAVNVSRAETMAEASELQGRLRDAYADQHGITVGKVLKAKEFVADRDTVGSGFMQQLYGLLDKQGMEVKQRAELEDALGQLYLSSMPDMIWAKHGIHRKGMAGFSQDARRAFAQNTFHGARYLAKLRYSDRLQDELTDMDKHISKHDGDANYNSVRARQVLDEMVKRHDAAMNPDGNPLSTALTSLGFIFHLGLSPASAMVNLTQTALVAYPVMGAKWGYAKASAALLRASKESVRGKNDITAALNGDERAAYDEAVRAGVIDVTMAHDLAGIAQGEDRGVMWKLRPIMKLASGLFHHAEKFNRQTTFVAAYRLARDAGAGHQQAYADAVKATYDGHFDYSANNRPRIMQGNVARVLLLFKQFSQNMIYTLVRSANQSLKAETPAARREARKMLAGLLTMHAMAAGTLGLPLVGTLLSAASMLGGSDDEPWDAQVALQNLLADTFGQKTAEVLAHGLSRLTPGDISGRVGLNQLIFPDIQEGLEGQRLAESAMTAALGPVAGIGVNVLKGMLEISEGQYRRGLESMAPSFLRAPLKTIRYGSEGVKDKSGVVIKDEVDFPGLVSQFLGFSPSDVRLAYEGKSAIVRHDRALQARRSSLMDQYAMATMAGDEDGKIEAREAIEKFNDKNPNRAIRPMQLAQSIRMRLKRIEQAESGVYLPNRRRDSLDEGRFAMQE